MAGITYPEEFAFRLESKSIEAEERRKGRTEAREISARERLGKAQIKSSEKLKLGEIKGKQKIALKQFGTKTSRFKQLLKPFQPAPSLSKEQDMLHDLFGGRGENRVMFQNPDSSCQVQIKGDLMPSTMGDDFDDGETTGNLFGFGINKSTGTMFGI
jgi:hypothetical protein